MSSRIEVGSDESLKGDTFGGLTVAAVLVTPETVDALVACGVTDSKKFADHQIPLLAQRIRELCAYTCVHSIYPEDYNKYSLTGLLNRHHKLCYQEVIQQAVSAGQQYGQVVHIVDKYPGSTVGDIIEVRAESTYVSVAAASILAREAALQQLASLSARAGFTLPKGSTHVEPALQRLFSSDLVPGLFVKLHFKNVRKHLEMKHLGKNTTN